jgi:hypothetical protein
MKKVLARPRYYAWHTTIQTNNIPFVNRARTQIFRPPIPVLKLNTGFGAMSVMYPMFPAQFEPFAVNFRSDSKTNWTKPALVPPHERRRCNIRQFQVQFAGRQLVIFASSRRNTLFHDVTLFMWVQGVSALSTFTYMKISPPKGRQIH